jgi:hypothetical protein
MAVREIPEGYNDEKVTEGTCTKPLFTSIVPDSETEDSQESSEKEPFTLSIILDSVKPGFIKSIYLIDPQGYENLKYPSESDLSVRIADFSDNTQTYVEIKSPLIDNKVIPCRLVIYNANTYKDSYYSKAINDDLKEGKLIYDSKYVTNNNFWFFHKAEMYLLGVHLCFNSKLHDNDYRYSHSCLDAKMAVRCLLTGYILHNKYKLKHKTRYLAKLWKIAASIDNSFFSIQKECEALSRYTEILEYHFSIDITEDDAMYAVQAVKKVCNFPPINELREYYSKEMDYEKFIEFDNNKDLVSSNKEKPLNE